MPSEDFEIRAEPEQLQAARDFFDDILRRKDGSLSEDHLYQELGDYIFTAQHASTVYDYVTCGQMSRPGYFSQDVINAASECADTEIRAAVNEVLDLVEGGMSIDELRTDYPRP